MRQESLVLLFLFSGITQAYNFANLKTNHDGDSRHNPFLKRGNPCEDYSHFAPFHRKIPNVVLDQTLLHHHLLHHAHIPPSNRYLSSHEPVSFAEESFQYNISSMGLLNPSQQNSTSVHHDHSMKFDETRESTKGYVESKVNGTLSGLGSFGAVTSLGWSDAAQSNGNQTSDGLSAMWLAFTSQEAITGAFTLGSRQISSSNNVLYSNVTVRTNVTVKQNGQFMFTIVVGELVSSQQEEDQIGSRQRFLDNLRCFQDPQSSKKYGSEASYTLQCIGSL